MALSAQAPGHRVWNSGFPEPRAGHLGCQATLPRGPARVSTRAPALPAFTAPTTGGPPSAFLGQQGCWKETSSSSGGLPAPQSLSTPRVPLSPWPPGGSGHSRAISPSWRVPGVKAADGVRVVRLHRKAGEVNAFCPEDQHVATSRNEVLQGWSPEPPSGSRPSPWGPQRPWRGSLGGALWAGLSGRAVGSQH